VCEAAIRGTAGRYEEVIRAEGRTECKEHGQPVPLDVSPPPDFRRVAIQRPDNASRFFRLTLFVVALPPAAAGAQRRRAAAPPPPPVAQLTDAAAPNAPPA